MTPRDALWSVIRTWEDGILWRLEWDLDDGVWAFLPYPPWESLA